MKVDNLIFDLDGTLIDSFPGIQYAIKEALKITLPGRPIPNLRPLIGPPIREIFKKVIEDAAPDLINELERQFRLIYDNIGWRKSIAYKGLSETLAQLARLGVTDFIVTNKPILSTSKILFRLGINQYFREFISPDIKEPIFNSKAAMIAYLLKKHSLDKNTTAYVGDSEDDRLAAKKCHVKFVAIAYGYGKVLARKQSKKAILVSTFSDILNLFNE